MPVEEPALGAGAELLERLRGKDDGVRWVRPEGLHLTLHFFGSLPRAELDRLVETVRPAGVVAPFDVSLEGLGCFPDRGAPRVLWLGVGRGGPALAGLAHTCAGLLAAAGVAVDERPHRAHCTLGRVAEPRSGERRRAWTGQAIELPPFTARRLLLLETVPAAGGSRYTPRGEVPLAG